MPRLEVARKDARLQRQADDVAKARELEIRKREAEVELAEANVRFAKEGLETLKRLAARDTVPPVEKAAAEVAEPVKVESVDLLDLPPEEAARMIADTILARQRQQAYTQSIADAITDGFDLHFAERDARDADSPAEKAAAEAKAEEIRRKHGL